MVIVTHLFDGPVGHAAAAHLAISVQSGGPAAGLDAHEGLAAWPATRLAYLMHGSILPIASAGLFDELTRARLLRGVP